MALDCLIPGFTLSSPTARRSALQSSGSVLATACFPSAPCPKFWSRGTISSRHSCRSPCPVLVTVLEHSAHADDPSMRDRRSGVASWSMLSPSPLSDCGIPTLDDRWLSPTLQYASDSPDPWLACLSTASASATSSVIRQPQTLLRLESRLPLSTSLSILLGRHASLCACCLSWPILRYRHPMSTFADTPLLEVCSAKAASSLRRQFHQHFHWVSLHHLSGTFTPF